MAKVKKADVALIINTMKESYPDAQCALLYEDLYQLLISVVLSAQTTDKRVNEVTPLLFANGRDAPAIAGMEQTELEEILKPIGMYRTKAKNVIALSKIVSEVYGGAVPKEYKELISLPGVGRKTANVVLAVGFGEPRIAVDTHVFRLANRIGLTAETDVIATEEALMTLLPKSDWISMHHALIWHGRQVCNARKPSCAECRILPWCRRNGLKPMDHSLKESNTLRVNDLVIGDGGLRICVPLVGNNESSLLKEVADILPQKPDLVEWRVDRFQKESEQKILEMLMALKKVLAQVPIIFTYRSKKEGGEGDLCEHEYLSLLKKAIESGNADFIDIEMSCEPSIVKILIEECHIAGVLVILSKHYFEETPSKKIMENIFQEMIVNGADLPKLAVMATKNEDVLSLMEAANKIHKRFNGKPLIAISMGEKGWLSRIGGAQFGSFVTFASGREASAPGQIDIETLRGILKCLRRK